jgi:hypothetical protein
MRAHALRSLIVLSILFASSCGGGGGGGSSSNSSGDGNGNGNGNGSGGGNGAFSDGLAADQKFATLSDMLADPNVQAAIAALPADSAGHSAGAYYQGLIPLDPSGTWTTNPPGSSGQYNNGQTFGADTYVYQVRGPGLIDIPSATDAVGTGEGAGSFITGYGNQITVFDQFTETCASNGLKTRQAMIERFKYVYGTTNTPDTLTDYSVSSVVLGRSCPDSSCQCTVSGGSVVTAPPVGYQAYTTTPAIFARIGAAPTPVIAAMGLTIYGSGAGTVTSTPAGLSCSSSCVADVSTPAVTLTATAGANSTFIGWQVGTQPNTGCNTTGPCNLTGVLPGGDGATAIFLPTPRNSWVTQAPMPTARYGLAVAFGNGLIYAIGGANGAGTALATVEAYDPGKNTWTTNLPPMPTARRDAAVMVANVSSGNYPYTITTFVYVAGGYAANGAALSTVEAFNTSTKTWSSTASMVDARGDFGLCPPVSSGTGVGPLFAYGGFNGTTGLTTAEQGFVDGAHPEWAVIPYYALPSPIWAFGVSGAGQLILCTTTCPPITYSNYVFGGRNAQGSTNAVLAQGFNADTNAVGWASMAPMPQATTFPAVATDSTFNKAYVFGGLQIGGASSTVLNTTQIYDVNANTWAAGAVLPTARSNAGAALVNALTYVIGGDTGNQTPTNVVERYQP